MFDFADIAFVDEAVSLEDVPLRSPERLPDSASSLTRVSPADRLFLFRPRNSTALLLFSLYQSIYAIFVFFNRVDLRQL